MNVPQTVVFIGPSGSGKSTLAKLLVEATPLTLVRTYTTRPHRKEDDDSHVFVTSEEFDSLEKAGTFIGTIDIFGHTYGLPRLPATPSLLLLRAPVIPAFRAQYPDCLVIEIDASLDVLRERLEKRGSYDRMDDMMLTKEMEAGRKLADLHVDTSQTVQRCVEAILTLIDA